MFDFLSTKRKKNRWDLPDIETALQSSLKPISPRPEFIKNLQRGLMEFTLPESEPPGLEAKMVPIFALVGLVSLVFVFSLWIRLIMVVLSMLGMLRVTKRQGNHQLSASQK
jgi:hypothetical protein